MASPNLQYSQAPPEYTQSSPETKDGASNNPYCHSAAIPIQPAGKPAEEDTDDAPTKPDYQDPNHPHYVHPSPNSYGHGSPSPHPRRDWRRKRVLIPCILAFLFFLTTLWFTSIALGAQVFMILQPLPSNPTVQEINIYMDGQVYHTSVVTSEPTIAISASSPVRTPSTTPTATSTTALPITTGRLQLAPAGQPSLEDIDKKPGRRQVARFITVIRRT